MNVCFFLGTLKKSGGIGRVTSILLNELAEITNHNFFILSYYEDGTPNFYELNKKIKKGTIHNNETTMIKSILSGSPFKVRHYLKKNEIDVIVGCGALFFPLIYLATLFSNVKTIAWEHSNFFNVKDHRFQKQSRNLGIKKFDRVITLTKTDQKFYLENFSRQDTLQIYNPVDRELLNIKGKYDIDSKKIITVGRLTYQKNIENLVEVANIFLHKYPDWQWDIYGDGPMMDYLSEKINRYGLDDQVILKGQVKNIYSLYKNYSFQVMTSRYEGFPMTLLEGMANGLPLISYDILTGPNELIDDNINGFLIPPFESQYMASKIEILINNPVKRKEFSSINNQKINDYSLEYISNQWELLFEKI